MSSPKNNLIDTLRLILFCLLPSSLYFSYYPLISLGSDATMNFELSIPLIILFLFALLSIPGLCRFASEKTWKQNLLYFSIPLYVTVSLCWTENLLRGILTAGILWCIVIAIFSIYQLFTARKRCNTYNTYLRLAAYIYVITTMVVCLFCWAQCILDIAGLDRGITLLCPGCTSLSFGFPHPSGFAIEPQFMGNLLLFPSLLYLVGITYAKRFFHKKSHLIIFYIFACSCIFTLFLTFSRGAIYSLIAATLFLLLTEKIKYHASILRPALITLACLLLSVVSQGAMSAYSYTDSTFLSGISSSVSQLSLGIINIPAPQPMETPDISEESSEETAPDTPIFDGYVENSTDERLLLSGLAFSAWNKTYTTFAFGHGLGSSGVAIHSLFPSKTDEKEIVQNELLAILLELGITGLIIVIVNFAIIIKNTRSSRLAPLFYSILLAFALSLMFFSGLPNALHVYILPAILFLTLGEDQFIIDKIRNQHRR